MNTTQHERVNGIAPAPPPAPHRPTRAERIAADAAAKAEAARIRDEAKRDRARRDEKWAAEREQLRKDRKRTRKASNDQDRSERVTAWQNRLQKWWHAFVLVGAIVGVNIVAVAGQVTAFQAQPFGWTPLAAIGAAAVIESIAIYVGWHAHVALIEGDSVMRLRTASYTIAAGVGALNYHHYAPSWGLDDMAVMFGAASVLSPWLWAIHSRHVHRQALRAQGLIDPRAPKFSALRWLLHRGETWTALKWAVRYGEQSPVASILAVQTEETTASAGMLLDQTREDLLAVQSALIRAQSDMLTVVEMVTAQEESADDQVTVSRPIARQPEMAILPAAAVTEPVTEQTSDSDRPSDRERPDEQDNREAEKWIRAAMRRGRTPKLSDIRKKFPYSHGWAQARVRTAREELTAKGYRFLPANVVQPPTDSTSSGDAEVTADGA